MDSRNYCLDNYSRAEEAYKRKDYKEVISLIEKYLQVPDNGFNISLIFILAKAYQKQHSIDGRKKAEKIYGIILKLDPRDVHARLELGKLYAGQGKEQEAEELFKEYIEIDPRSVHARLELGKLYAGQGKEQEAENLLKKVIEIDPRDVHARLELGKLYAGQGKDEESRSVYEYIIKALPSDYYSTENRTTHILKHMKDDKRKEIHGIFNNNPIDLIEKLKDGMVEEYKIVGYMTDIYCIPCYNCGYAGGKTGDGHQLDYVTVICLTGTLKVITMFPSDNIKIV